MFSQPVVAKMQNPGKQTVVTDRHSVRDRATKAAVEILRPVTIYFQVPARRKQENKGVRAGTTASSAVSNPPSQTVARMLSNSAERRTPLLQPVTIYYKVYRAPGAIEEVQPRADVVPKRAAAEVRGSASPHSIFTNADTPPKMSAEVRRASLSKTLRFTGKEIVMPQPVLSMRISELPLLAAPQEKDTDVDHAKPDTGDTEKRSAAAPSTALPAESTGTTEPNIAESATYMPAAKDESTGTENSKHLPISQPADAGPVAAEPNSQPTSTVPESALVHDQRTDMLPAGATGETTLSENGSVASNIAPETMPEGEALAAEIRRLESDPIGLNNLGVRMSLAKRHSDAALLLERAVAASPNTAKLHLNLSIIYENLKRMPEALASAQKAAALAPGEPRAMTQLCGLELINDLASDAVGCYESLGKLEPLDVLEQTFYGIALLRDGRSDAAIVILEKVASTIPSRPDTLNALGVAYFGIKRYSDAALAFKRAVEIAPTSGQLRFNLAVAQLANRNKEGAISQYRLLKETSPELAADLYKMLFSDKVLSVAGVKR